MGSTIVIPLQEDLVAGSFVDISLNPNPALIRTVVVVSGRTTGTLTITKKAIGATRFTPFVPAATIDLTSVDEIVIEGAGLAAIKVTDGGSGADLVVSVTQLSV